MEDVYAMELSPNEKLLPFHVSNYLRILFRDTWQSLPQTEYANMLLNHLPNIQNDHWAASG